MNDIIPAAHPNLPIDPGQSLTIRGVHYIFERADPDGTVTLRAYQGSGVPDFMVLGVDGHPRKPTWSDLGALQSQGALDIHANQLTSQVRNRAREQGHDNATILCRKPKTAVRVAIKRAYLRNPCSKSERALVQLAKTVLSDPEIAAKADGWVPSASAIKGYIRDLDGDDSVYTVDGMSMQGNYPRKLKVGHPPEIAIYYMLLATGMRCITNAYAKYKNEIAMISNGYELKRPLLVGEHGDYHLSDRPAVYPQPETPYTALSEQKFRRWVKRLESRKAFRVRTSRDAETNEFGGGGERKPLPQIGDLFQYDDTPLPKEIFAVTLKGSVSIGSVTLALMTECVTGVIIGWHLSMGSANATTVCRTLLSANVAKSIPDHFLKLEPSLPWIRGKPTGVIFDNPTHHHGHSVEEYFKEIQVAAIYAGARTPRHKALVECILGILQSLLLGELPDRLLDPTREYRYGKRDDKVECTFDDIERHLPSVIALYNLMQSSTHDKRPRALVWKTLLGTRKLAVIKDVERWEKQIGTIDTKHSITNKGLDIFNRRYTPDAKKMAQILEDFRRGVKVQSVDGAPPKGAKRDQKSFKVKIKINEEDLRYILVENPYRLGGAEWEVFECQDKSLYGVPRWLHEHALEQAAIESANYITDEEQAIMRANVLADLRSMDPRADERDRAFLAKAVSSPGTRHFVSQLTQVTDEVTPENYQPFRTTHTVTGRKVVTSVPKSTAPRNLRTAQRPPAEQSALDQEDQRTSKAGRSASSISPDACPEPEAPRKSADQPDKPARKSARSNLKWSDLS